MKNLTTITDNSNALFDGKSNIVVLCFDNKYLFPAINTMNSIHLHNDNVSFVCLCSSLKEQNLQRLLDMKEYGVRVLEIRWNKSVNTRFYPIDVAFNLYIPWLLPDIQKCLYVDPDVMCIRNISEIFNSDATIAMSLELSGLVNNLARKLPHNNFNDILYYNTGVMFMNLEKIRANHLSKEIDEEFVGKIDQYYLLDQDFLNSYFRNEITTLPILWNVQWYEFYGSYFYKYVIKNAFFIHFSFHKPWRHTSPFRQSSLYLKFTTNSETKRMVKKARIKRLFNKIFAFIIKPYNIIFGRRKK